MIRNFRFLLKFLFYSYPKERKKKGKARGKFNKKKGREKRFHLAFLSRFYGFMAQSVNFTKKNITEIESTFHAKIFWINSTQSCLINKFLRHFKAILNLLLSWKIFCFLLFVEILWIWCVANTHCVEILWKFIKFPKTRRVWRVETWNFIEEIFKFLTRFFNE